MAQEYDAIIVGARMAGAATAALLAEQGARVLLVDRATFPAPTVSCPVFFGNSLASFERIGVLDAVEAIGAPRIRHYGNRSPNADLVTLLPPSQGRDYAYAIRRDVLDTAVLRRVAERPGVTLREGFSVTGLLWGAGQVAGVRGRQGGGPEESIYARAVIGADGKRSLVARLVDASMYRSLPGATCIFYAYYRNFATIGEPSAIVYADAGRTRGALVFDADAGLTVVSVGLPAAEFDEARKDAEGTLERIWRSFPELAARGRGAERATPVMGQGPVPSYYRQPFGPGWALVGDAGHYIDPITGQGINNALRSAELFAQAWARAQGRAGWQRAMAGFQRQRDAETLPMYNLTRTASQLQDGAVANISATLMTAFGEVVGRNPDIATSYIGIFNGATPIPQFFHPLNIARILATDAARQSAARLATIALQPDPQGV
jgi:2-polyprenyl-6-methoxyphenol hydroxylase-like FAD-dependent oxidoreductase